MRGQRAGGALMVKSMTITQIADMAGVSRAAVSRYFNNGYLSEEKKAAIAKAVEETGYRPSLQAQMLRTKKTKTIGVIIPKIDSTSIGHVVSGILNVLDASGYRMFLADTQNNPDKEVEYLNAFNEELVDGIIMAGTVFKAAHKKAMKSLHVPLVIVGQQVKGVNCIYHDDYNAELELTRRFVKAGKTKFGYLGVTPKDKAVGQLRYQGFLDALKEAGIDFSEENHMIGEFTMRSGVANMEKLYRKNPDLEVVVCATDRIAAGAQKWLRMNQVDIPEKIQLAGQGDSALVGAMVPPITTLHYYYEESGAAAAKRVLELIEEKDAGTESVVKEERLGFQLLDHVVE